VKEAPDGPEWVHEIKFDRGLASLGSLPETPERDRQEVELRLANGVSLITADGFASPDAAEAYTRARDLCEKRGDTYRLLVALFGLWNFARTSDFDAARNLSHRMLVLTREHDASGCDCRLITPPGRPAFFAASLSQGSRSARRDAGSMTSNGIARTQCSTAGTTPGSAHESSEALPAG
jgi:hypothetical protein